MKIYFCGSQAACLRGEWVGGCWGKSKNRVEGRAAEGTGSLQPEKEEAAPFTEALQLGEGTPGGPQDRSQMLEGTARPTTSFPGEPPPRRPADPPAPPGSAQGGGRGPPPSPPPPKTQPASRGPFGLFGRGLPAGSWAEGKAARTARGSWRGPARPSWRRKLRCPRAPMTSLTARAASGAVGGCPVAAARQTREAASARRRSRGRGSAGEDEAGPGAEGGLKTPRRASLGRGAGFSWRSARRGSPPSASSFLLKEMSAFQHGSRCSFWSLGNFVFVYQSRF